jgi:hypothetical protein
MAETMVEYRNTKEILDGIVRNAAKYSKFEFKSVYEERTRKMFYCVKKIDSNSIYEVKVTKKTRIANHRIEPDNVEISKDALKQEFLVSLRQIVSCVFKKVYSHEGDVLVSDNNNDYIVSMIKKMNLSWENPYEKS